MCLIINSGFRLILGATHHRAAIDCELRIAPRNSITPSVKRCSHGTKVIWFLNIISFVPSMGKRNSSWPGSKRLNSFTSLKS